jgi:hypothetical protein
MCSVESAFRAALWHPFESAIDATKRSTVAAAIRAAIE